MKISPGKSEEHQHFFEHGLVSESLIFRAVKIWLKGLLGLSLRGLIVRRGKEWNGPRMQVRPALEGLKDRPPSYTHSDHPIKKNSGKAKKKLIQEGGYLDFPLFGPVWAGKSMAFVRSGNL